MKPFSAKVNGRIGTYRMGTWPYETGTPKTPSYATPKGFIEVTPENFGTPVSEHFTLGEFVTKDQRDVWPKYVVLDRRLIDKLELTIAELNAGLQREGLAVMSGFRTPQYNERGVGAGGRSAVSRHQYGDAADIFRAPTGRPHGRLEPGRTRGHEGCADPGLRRGSGGGEEPGARRRGRPLHATTAHGPFVHIDARGKRARWGGSPRSVLTGKPGETRAFSLGSGPLSTENGALDPRRRAHRPKTGFLRVVSRWEIVALSVNDVIGSGVYLILPVAAAMLLGAASVWAILAAGFAVLLLVLCFAEAGSLFDKPGGAIVYTRAAFGDFVGFEVGWMTWIARISSIAGPLGLLRAGGRLPLGRPRKRRRPAGHDRPAAARADLDQRPGREVGRADRRLPGLRQGRAAPAARRRRDLRGRLEPRFSGADCRPAANFMEAALLVLFAYAGFENTAAPAGEFRNPKRDIPFALIVQIGIVTAIYTPVQLVAIGTVPNLGRVPDAARRRGPRC